MRVSRKWLNANELRLGNSEPTPEARQRRSKQRNRRRPLHLLRAVIPISVLAATRFASADSVSWQGGVGDWLNANNWFDLSNGLDQTPGNSDYAYIENGGTAQISTGDAAASNIAIDGSSAGVSGAGSLSVANGEYIGVTGAGAFTQTGGTNTASLTLQLGYLNDSSGAYTLTGDGSLTVGGKIGFVGCIEDVGLNGAGDFNQSGGTNSIINHGFLYVGYSTGSTGTYELSGTGNLSLLDGSEVVGVSGAGTFTQTGGTNTTFTLGVDDTYTLSGTGSLSVTDFETISNTGNFTQTGGTNTANILEINGPEGSAGATYSLSGTGKLTVAGQETLGNAGPGTVNQGGGTSTAGALVIALGSYMLSGTGSLSTTGNEQLGNFGLGTFVQTGGTNTVGANLEVGPFTSAPGSYLLAGTASLTVVGTESVSNGTFNQSGGTNTAQGQLTLAATKGGAGTYILGGDGNLNVTGSVYVGGSSSAAEGSGVLTVSGGQMTVDGTLKVWSSAGTQVTISGGTLSAANTFNLANINVTGGSANLGAVTGRGALNIDDASASVTAAGLQQTSVIIASGGKLKLTGGGGANAVKSLFMDNLGILDLASTSLIINYGTNPNPIAAVRGYLVSGYAAGAWNGTGIDSSSAAANPGFGVGYADGADNVVAGLTSGQLEIKYTLYGDVNLDGVVNADDFTILVGNLGKAVTGWDEGDFNYDGAVNADDFTAMLGNLGKQASGADITLPAADLAAIDAFAAANGLLADVPEPASANLLSLGALSLFAKRRRR
jgi:hypothetical protein